MCLARSSKGSSYLESSICISVFVMLSVALVGGCGTSKPPGTSHPSGTEYLYYLYEIQPKGLGVALNTMRPACVPPYTVEMCVAQFSGPQTIRGVTVEAGHRELDEACRDAIRKKPTHILMQSVVGFLEDCFN